MISDPPLATLANDPALPPLAFRACVICSSSSRIMALSSTHALLALDVALPNIDSDLLRLSPSAAGSPSPTRQPTSGSCARSPLSEPSSSASSPAVSSSAAAISNADSASRFRASMPRA
eukprot:2610663-Rhodomonas_salina.1